MTISCSFKESIMPSLLVQVIKMILELDLFFFSWGMSFIPHWIKFINVYWYRPGAKIFYKKIGGGFWKISTSHHHRNIYKTPCNFKIAGTLFPWYKLSRGNFLKFCLLYNFLVFIFSLILKKYGFLIFGIFF